MLGMESAIAGSWATEKPERMSVADARRLVDDDPGFDRMVGLGVIRSRTARQPWCAPS